MGLADVLPAVCVGGCSLALPLPAVAFALLSRDLVSKVVLEVEFYIINVLQAVLVTHALMRLTLLVEQQGHEEQPVLSAGSVQSAQSGKSAQSAQSVQSEQDEQDLEVRPFASCKMRIIEPTMHPCVVRTDATMAAMFLGAYSRAEAWLFDLGARQSRSTGLLWLLWFLGVSIGLLVLADVLLYRVDLRLAGLERADHLQAQFTWSSHQPDR